MWSVVHSDIGYVLFKIASCFVCTLMKINGITALISLLTLIFHHLLILILTMYLVLVTCESGLCS